MRSLDETREAIARLLPAVPVEHMTDVGQGQNSRVFLVNGEWIVRLPKHESAARVLVGERALLTRLRGRLPLVVPDPLVATPEGGSAGMVYRLLPGVPLTPTALAEMPEASQQHIATRLLGFLRALHTLPLAEVGGTSLVPVASYAAWAEMYEQVRSRIFPLMRPDARRQVGTLFDGYLGAGSAAIPEALVHGDFGPGNILYQPDARPVRVSGIIDWSSAGRGDPAVDLAALIGPVSYPLAVIATGFSAYPEAEEMLTRAHFYASTFALQDALFGLEHDDAEAFESGIAQYR